MDNLELWNKVKQPPAEVLKPIKGGRLSGMTDISPAWRMRALTEEFGICGIGWKYSIKRLWTESASDGQLFAFAEIDLFVNIDGKWSEPIPGIGGNMLIQRETHTDYETKQKEKVLYSNDEAYKMAVTDAIGVAAKALGFGADIYLGQFDGSKYTTKQETEDTKWKADFLKVMGELIPKISKKDSDHILEEHGIKSISNVKDRDQAESIYNAYKFIVAQVGLSSITEEQRAMFLSKVNPILDKLPPDDKELLENKFGKPSKINSIGMTNDYLDLASELLTKWKLKEQG